MNLKVITQNGIVLEKETESVSLPTSKGRVEILPLHADMVVILSTGKIFYNKKVIDSFGGFAQIYNGEVLIVSPKVSGMDILPV